MSSQGSQAAFAIADEGTAIGSFTYALDLVSESIKKTGSIINASGLRGIRAHVVERTRTGPYTVGGDITLHPSAADLDVLLPYIMGADESTDTFAFGETLASHEFAFLKDLGPKRALYDGCAVNRATFRASSGNPLELVLNVIGKTETISDTAFPSITPGVTSAHAPYTFEEGVLTLVSSTRTMMDFELVIDNVVVPRFSNSTTATDTPTTDQIVTLKTTNPYTSSETDLYAQALAGTTGTLVFTNGGLSLTFTFAKLQVPDNTPVVSGRGEIPLVLEMTARKSGSTEALEITSDAAA